MGLNINHGRVSHSVQERDICLVCLKSSKIFVVSVLNGSIFNIVGMSEIEGKSNPHFARIIEINKKQK